MKQLLTTFLFFSLLLSGFSQAYVEVDYKGGYTGGVFYRLTNDSKINIPNTDWDIALTAFGTEDAGIHLNEAAGLFEGGMALYETNIIDFDEPLDVLNTEDSLYNDELSWLYGAFNSNRDLGNPLDYGWGIFDPVSNKIVGNKVFVIQLRNGLYRKIKIESLDQNIYTIRHANLDGSDEVNLSIDKADYSAGGLILVSLESEQPLDVLTTPWDLFFTRYVSPLDPGTGTLVDYTVTGVLSGPDVLIAEARGIDPTTVEEADYENDYAPELDVIGHDWKEFDLGNGGWVIYDDLAYFVKTPTGQIWRIVFINFEGSSTGVVVFEKTFVGGLSSISDQSAAFNSFDIFPNPATDQARIIYELKESAEVQFGLYNMQGQALWTANDQAGPGLNALEFATSDYPAGSYLFVIRSGEEIRQKLLQIL
ncbi:MAG: T9SS type A sorting domain-containing protein [Saprospiraceae bacterium]|nr:T9SS type A sorting domain-containing protein [Saprospiraceae bacterium]